MQENYLAKWLNNELSEEELTEFKKSDEYTTYRKILEASGTLEGPDFDVDQALTALKNKRELTAPKVVQLHPFRKFLRVAAAIAVLLVASYFYLNSLDENISTQFAENKEVVLPDNSEITLNADSEISYSEKAWDKERNISLKGEAFFKVAKGKRFTVSTKAGTVAVLGTQFNVENRNGFFEVTCYEGLVSVTFNGKETKLPAGNSFMAINGKIAEGKVVNISQPSWMSNESSFKSIPLQYVLDEFERQHNITVETKNIDLNQLYTGTFSNTNVDLALQSISVPSQIKFNLEGNKVLFYAENAP
jgi:ferric-dicitrate binding protein FerR (iron transport regulator)